MGLPGSSLVRSILVPRKLEDGYMNSLYGGTIAPHMVQLKDHEGSAAGCSFTFLFSYVLTQGWYTTLVTDAREHGG